MQGYTETLLRWTMVAAEPANRAAARASICQSAQVFCLAGQAAIVWC
jgi:hypothetical protein